ncbi:MAG: type IV secretion system protein [Deltaproteobacteria bacterium]|nr:type IV secretion system protein [Deltaproteobacteria bacterium]
MANAALFITNALSSAKPASGSVTAEATATAKNLISNSSLTYNAFLQTVSFMANNLISLMQYIANAALIIAGSLFTFEIIRMTIEYMITHEAKKLTQSMVRKLFLFLIVSAFVSHIQQIMAFIFNSFVNIGTGVVGQVVSGGGGGGSTLLANPLFAWGELGQIWSFSMDLLSSLDTNWTNVVKGIPDVFLVYAILLIISLLIIFIIIQFFIIQLEIIIQMSIGSIAIAFSMLSYTQDIAKNYIKSLLNMGIRLFTIIVVIYFFNYVTLYNTLVLAQLATADIKSLPDAFQIIQNALLSILFLSILIAFFVAKAPALVANAMSGSGSGSGLDAGVVMGAAAAGAFEGANVAVGAAKATGTAASGAVPGVWNAPGAIMDAPGNIKNSVAGAADKFAGAADKFKEDWNKRLHRNQVNNSDFVPQEPPKDNSTN